MTTADKSFFIIHLLVIDSFASNFLICNSYARIAPWGFCRQAALRLDCMICDCKGASFCFPYMQSRSAMRARLGQFLEL
jgi:hypothetical protein